MPNVFFPVAALSLQTWYAISACALMINNWNIIIPDVTFIKLMSARMPFHRALGCTYDGIRMSVWVLKIRARIWFVWEAAHTHTYARSLFVMAIHSRQYCRQRYYCTYLATVMVYTFLDNSVVRSYFVRDVRCWYGRIGWMKWWENWVPSEYRCLYLFTYVKAITSWKVKRGGAGVGAKARKQVSDMSTTPNKYFHYAIKIIAYKIISLATPALGLPHASWNRERMCDAIVNTQRQQIKLHFPILFASHDEYNCFERRRTVTSYTS